jgi:hypothetical protein
MCILYSVICSSVLTMMVALFSNRLELFFKTIHFRCELVQLVRDLRTVSRTVVVVILGVGASFDPNDYGLWLRTLPSHEGI